MEQERTTEAQTTEEYLNPDASATGETPTSSSVGKQTLTKKDVREGHEPGEFRTTPELDESLAEAGISVSSPEEGDNTGTLTSDSDAAQEAREAEHPSLGLDPDREV